VTTHHQDIFEIENAAGERLHCVHDHQEGGRGLVVIPPVFGGTSRLNLLPMLYLVRNGFDVLRFDFTHHLGNSFGDCDGFTLSGALADVDAVMAQAAAWRAEGRVSAVAAVGISLSGRLFTRHLARTGGASVDVVLSLLGVVDVGYTARLALDIDVARLLADPAHVYGRGKVMGYVVDRDRFMRDMVAQDWHSPETTRRELAVIEQPTYLIAAERDEWVPQEQIEAAYAGAAARVVRSYRIPNASHELYRNPPAFKTAAKALADCLGHFFGGGQAPAGEPSIIEVIERNTAERQRESRYESGGPTPVVREPTLDHGGTRE
jgi:pimeloyl-ACP methyl ester carboxylesterase